jgi:rod shape-determining protein MreC
VLGLLVLLALALITISFRSQGLTPVQDAGSQALRPFQVAAERISRPFRDAYGWTAGLVHARSENERLKREVDGYRAQAVDGQQLEADNETFRPLLAYRDAPRFPKDYSALGTRVISPPQSSFEQTIVIAAGRRDGIRRDYPVVTDDGLVGKVSVVGNATSKVMLLTDENSAVAATDLGHPGATGIVKHGQGGLDTLVLDRVTKDQTVEAGDPVVTQGTPGDAKLPSIYPRGIMVGTVASVNQRDTDLYKQIQVRPFVDFSSLSSVLVLVPKRGR